MMDVTLMGTAWERGSEVALWKPRAERFAIAGARDERSSASRQPRRLQSDVSKSLHREESRGATCRKT